MSLTLFMTHTRLKSQTHHPELIPHSSLFFTNPPAAIMQWIQWVRITYADNSREAEAKKLEVQRDLERRREFRRAHGLPEMRGLPAKLGLGTVEEDQRIAAEKKRAEDAEAQAQAELVEQAKSTGAVLSPKGQRVKKWFGIWE
jgi:hypothetical protein